MLTNLAYHSGHEADKMLHNLQSDLDRLEGTYEKKVADNWADLKAIKRG